MTNPMRPNPAHETTDPQVVRELIEANPWGILVSAATSGPASEQPDAPVASHVPLLLEEQPAPGHPGVARTLDRATPTGIVVVTHLGRPDDELHRLGEREVLLIVQGPHGYISPSWTDGASRVPTWNYTVAHCHGTPELLDAQRNLHELARLVERFERCVQRPVWLDCDYGEPLARRTVGIRLPVASFRCKRKLSQDRDAATHAAIVAALRAAGPYRNPALADDMERVAQRSDEQPFGR